MTRLAEYAAAAHGRKGPCHAPRSERLGVEPFSEEELEILVATGEESARFKSRNRGPRHSGHTSRTPIDLDYLTHEYIVRTTKDMFERPAPKRLQADVTYALLEIAELQGLVVEEAPRADMVDAGGQPSGCHGSGRRYSTENYHLGLAIEARTTPRHRWLSEYEKPPDTNRHPAASVGAMH